jgi:hypothetical protein
VGVQKLLLLLLATRDLTGQVCMISATTYDILFLLQTSPSSSSTSSAASSSLGAAPHMAAYA